MIELAGVQGAEAARRVQNRTSFCSASAPLGRPATTGLFVQSTWMSTDGFCSNV